MPTVLRSTELGSHQAEIGSKALNLARLEQLGLRVPKFVVIPASSLKGLDVESVARLAHEAIRLLTCEHYAVRSAALIEDAATSSYAGQFRTKIDVKKEQLAQALKEVIVQAEAYLHGHLEQFSVIVQEYIEADMAGVAFTRHPAGERQMFIEYHHGRGEDLVSGTIRPTAIEVFWTELIPVSELPLSEVVASLKKLESEFGHPQDVEWCCKAGQWYWLQTRPITTISIDQYQSLRYLDEVLPSGKSFFFEQTEISEIAPRPSPFTKSILERIYAKDGPVEQVYQKYHVTYEASDSLRIIGNQLFIDREQELKTLLPAYSYFGSKKLKPTRVSFAGLWPTLKNQWALMRLPNQDAKLYVQQLEAALKNIPAKTSLRETWQAFQQAYALIFEVNLLAGAYLKQLDVMLKPVGMEAVRILSTAFRRQMFEQATKPPQGPWLGNGLEISNQEPFLAHVPRYPADPALNAWWKALPLWRQTALKPFLERACAFDELRERGRWLTVGYMNAFRRLVNPERYFLTIDECEQGEQKEKVVQRRREYERFSAWTFPSRLTNITVLTNEQGPVGVSAGTAEGMLVSKNQIPQYANKSLILYSEALTPDLVQYFSLIKGIVSAQGGMLSHLAILAREQGIPVITNVQLKKSGLELEQFITMDGAKGRIEKL